MLRYILKRLLSMLLTLFLLATAVFFLLRFIPGSPFTRERTLSPEIEALLREKYNMDAPLWQQYLDYMGDLLHLDLGTSIQMLGVRVNDMIRNAFPVSAALGFWAILLVIVIGIPLGVLAALKRGRWPDYLISFLTTLGIAVPSFVIGSFILYVFGERLGWLPPGGLYGWRSYIGPVLALGGFSMAFVTRLTRSSMLDVTSMDYIRTARANGLPRGRIVFRHALKNALIPVVTYLGSTFAAIITGSFVVEKIFAVPGMGKYFVESINNRDYTVIMGTTLFFAALYVVMVFLVDVAYALIDPRIKLQD
ncbi:MAG: ABC transporter permease [Clostridiales bacterium]|uniref:Oligopeptide transport system permease protein n=1 Tax=Harryflintia acetispora TaxID=1849041 RepID=A0A9X8UL83_9FIRM|nr:MULTISPECIES: ABC transporter permease [Oscillospiraceae]PWM38907.1 MAG: ABC transporter permease [Clostridiales bacterium]RGB65423.1 ABC transporter permease [Harryflintia acetispora]TCL45101.1 oligopeptide transport system permease protein [Harryflintia acetispora]